MGDIITYVIVVLFFVFFIYFIYTVIDVFFLSKRRRKVKSPHPVSYTSDDEKSENKGNNIEDDEGGDSDAEKNNSKLDKLSSALSALKDSDKSNDKSKPKEKKETGERTTNKKEDDEVKAKSEETHPSNKEKRKFSLFSGVFKKKDKKSLFETEKLDDAYKEIITAFAEKNSEKYTQKDFQELVMTVISKGYDRRPSEIDEDLQITIKELDEEKRFHRDANFVSKPDLENEVLEEESEKDEGDNEVGNEPEDAPEEKKEKDVDTEEELRTLVEKNKDSKDTRSELDKTLAEIREIRKRLSSSK